MQQALADQCTEQLLSTAHLCLADGCLGAGSSSDSSLTVGSAYMPAAFGARFSL